MQVKSKTSKYRIPSSQNDPDIWYRPRGSDFAHTPQTQQIQAISWWSDTSQRWSRISLPTCRHIENATWKQVHVRTQINIPSIKTPQRESLKSSTHNLGYSAFCKSKKQQAKVHISKKQKQKATVDVKKTKISTSKKQNAIPNAVLEKIAQPT